MNYKKIIKNQKTRFKILKLLKWVPDSLMLRIQYRIQMGFWPNLKHPKRFTEKLQVYKLKYRNPLMHQCVDKYDVREYVKSKGLEHILNDCYGVFDRAENICLETLPKEFVAKTTDGTGGFNVKIVEDKEVIEMNSFRNELNGWLGKKDINAGREWAYVGIKKSRIIVEKLLRQNLGGAVYMIINSSVLMGKLNLSILLQTEKMGLFPLPFAMQISNSYHIQEQMRES